MTNGRSEPVVARLTSAGRRRLQLAVFLPSLLSVVALAAIVLAFAGGDLSRISVYAWIVGLVVLAASAMRAVDPGPVSITIGVDGITYEHRKFRIVASWTDVDRIVRFAERPTALAPRLDGPRVESEADGSGRGHGGGHRPERMVRPLIPARGAAA